MIIKFLLRSYGRNVGPGLNFHERGIDPAQQMFAGKRTRPFWPLTSINRQVRRPCPKTGNEFLWNISKLWKKAPRRKAQRPVWKHNLYPNIFRHHPARATCGKCVLLLSHEGVLKGGAYSLVACFSRMIIDHASLSKWIRGGV